MHGDNAPPAWWRRFLPQQPAANWRDTARASLGICLGVALTGFISTAWLGPYDGLPWLMASAGASAILLFAMPASPLAQPSAILAGNLVGALAGVTAAQLIAAPLPAALAAVSVTFVLMSALRCVHPPSGAVALTAVLGGPHIAALGYRFVFAPVGLNSLILVLTALAYHAATKRSYPHQAHVPLRPHPAPSKLPLDTALLNEVLADYGETLDISGDDLAMVVRDVLERLRCQDIRAGR